MAAPLAELAANSRLPVLPPPPAPARAPLSVEVRILPVRTQCTLLVLARCISILTHARAPLAGDLGGDDSDVPEGLGLSDAARRAAELPKAVRDYIDLCFREAGRAADDGADDNKAYDQAAGERGDLLREAAAHAQYLMRSIRRPGERYIMQAVVSACCRGEPFCNFEKISTNPPLRHTPQKRRASVRAF